MSFATRQNQSDAQKIQDIITAFGIYALGDIEKNIESENPIAAFILSSCWIDQVALFVYNHNEQNLNQHYQNFIVQYLTKYADMDLYTNLRCKLVHSYSIGPNIRLGRDEDHVESKSRKSNPNLITIIAFYKDLKKAWEIIKNELLTIGNKSRENALLRFNISPTLIEVDSKILIYNKVDSNFLIDYYKGILKGKFLNGKKPLQITSIEKEVLKGYEDSFIILVVIKKSKNKKLFENLERVTQQFNLPFPSEVLKTKNNS